MSCSHSACAYCTICSQCTSPAVESEPPPTVALTTPVSILDDPDKAVSWQVNFSTRKVLRIIWQQRLGRIHSRGISDIHKYAIGYPTSLSPPRSMTALFASRPSYTKPTSLPLLPARLLSAINVFLSPSALSCNLPRPASAFVASAAFMAKRVTYCGVTISVTHIAVHAPLRSKAPAIEWLTK